MARKRKNRNRNGDSGNSENSTVTITKETLDAMAEGAEEVESNDTDDVDDAAGGSPAQEESRDDSTTPAPASTPPPALERIRRELAECTAKYQAAQQLHNSVSLAYYDAANTAKALKKDRDEALERLATLKNELDYLTAREADLRDAPAGLFEAEVANEWREFDISVTNIQGALAGHLREGGLSTLGEIADWTAGGRRLNELDGIGPEGAAKVADLIAAFFEKNPRYVLEFVSNEETAGEPARVPARVKVKGRVELPDGDALEDGSEWDVWKYEDGVATVDLGNGQIADVPFGSYAVLEWRAAEQIAGDPQFDSDDVPDADLEAEAEAESSEAANADDGELIADPATAAF